MSGRPLMLPNPQSAPSVDVIVTMKVADLMSIQISILSRTADSRRSRDLYNISVLVPGDR
jgi:hypothetical protein